MIDLSILKENPELAKNIRLEVSGTDLLAFGEYLQSHASETTIKSKSQSVEEYLTPKQFAEALQISLVTLWSWDKKKITLPLHIGSQKRYRRSDLEKIMNHI
jgi:hypothetical protein